MNSIDRKQLFTILATLVTLTINGLANALPLNGQGTGEISDRFDIYFVPAGYVFSIWGLIYLGLLAYTVYQAMPAQRDNALLKRIAPLYWLASAANSAWIFLWHYEVFLLTLLAMGTLLVCLIAMYRQVAASSLDGRAQWLVRLPFGIYLGWISVATIANVTQVLYFVSWGGWGISAELWAVIMLVVASVLGLLMLWRERDLAYALVLVWAFAGIGVSQAGSALVSNAAWATAVLLVVAAVVILLMRRGRQAVN